MFVLRTGLQGNGKTLNTIKEVDLKAAKDGQQSRILLDKAYFGVYESTAEGADHHMRFKPPKALWVLGICMVISLFLGYRFYSSRFVDSVKPITEEQTKQIKDKTTEQ